MYTAYSTDTPAPSTAPEHRVRRHRGRDPIRPPTSTRPRNHDRRGEQPENAAAVRRVATMPAGRLSKHLQVARHGGPGLRQSPEIAWLHRTRSAARNTPASRASHRPRAGMRGRAPPPLKPGQCSQHRRARSHTGASAVVPGRGPAQAASAPLTRQCRLRQPSPT